MVALDFKNDPTLDAMHAAIIARETAKPVYTRNLGASLLGDECERKIYFHINQVPKQEPTSSMVYAVEDGYHCEDIVAQRLQLVKGITLWTRDENDKQFGFKDFDGRLKGYCDGVIIGLLQAPKTPHVWEHKSKNCKLFNEFVKLKEKTIDEKGLLKAWDMKYYVQAQLLMGYLELERHYCTVSDQGARNISSCRTDFDHEFFNAQRQKAARIFGYTDLPKRITEHRGYFKCRFCDFENHCWSLSQ